MAKRPGGPPRPQTRITLDCQPARAIGGGQFESLTTAVVTDGNRAMAGLKIQFYANSAVVGGEVTTDPNGRTTQALRFAGTAGRSVNVEAQVVGGSIRSSATITLPLPIARIRAENTGLFDQGGGNGSHPRRLLRIGIQGAGARVFVFFLGVESRRALLGLLRGHQQQLLAFHAHGAGLGGAGAARGDQRGQQQRCDSNTGLMLNHG